MVGGEKGWRGDIEREEGKGGIPPYSLNLSVFALRSKYKNLGGRSDRPPKSTGTAHFVQHKHIHSRTRHVCRISARHTKKHKTQDSRCSPYLPPALPSLSMATSAMDPNRGAMASHEPEEASRFRACARCIWSPCLGHRNGAH